MLCFRHDADAFRHDALHDLRRDLPRHAFLNLETARENVHQTRQFADSEDFAARNVEGVETYATVLLERK